VLRALGTPLAFLGLLVGFLLAVVVQAYAQAATARALGDRAAFRRLGGVRRVLDPFGAVAAALAGPGWGVTPEIPLRSRARLALALLAGPLAVAALGALALVAFVLAGGERATLPGSGPGAVLAGVAGPPVQVFTYALGLELLGMAVLALVPLPPLPGWRLLELASTGSVGWQRARDYLVEKNLGVLALLVLLILPLGASTPLLLAIVDTAVGSLLGIAA
jgi:predicted membrane protein